MRSRLLVRAAALALGAGGLLAIPAGPAFADCSHPNHPDQYNGGGIHFQRDGTIVRTGPHLDCRELQGAFPLDGINVFCARNVDGSQNDWAYLRILSTGIQGWARESTLRVPDPVDVDQCAAPGTLRFGNA